MTISYAFNTFPLTIKSDYLGERDVAPWQSVRSRCDGSSDRSLIELFLVPARCGMYYPVYEIVHGAYKKKTLRYITVNKMC